MADQVPTKNEDVKVDSSKKGDSAPVLPLRDIVVFPHMIVPLFVGREKSVRALEEVMNEDKQILLLTQKVAAEDDPTSDGLHTIGTLATVLQLLKLPDQTVRVLVEGKGGKELQNMKALLNMQFPQFNGTLHLSYESITSKKIFNELIEDAYSFAYKHTVKSSGIDQGTISYPDRKVYGIYYTIDGNAASSVQFYLTDSTKHYIRGALYFNTEPRLDSIQPVLTFVKQDVDLMIKSFKWK